MLAVSQLFSWKWKLGALLQRPWRKAQLLQSRGFSLERRTKTAISMAHQTTAAASQGEGRAVWILVHEPVSVSVCVCENTCTHACLGIRVNVIVCVFHHSSDFNGNSHLRLFFFKLERFNGARERKTRPSSLTSGHGVNLSNSWKWTPSTAQALLGSMEKHWWLTSTTRHCCDSH